MDIIQHEEFPSWKKKLRTIKSGTMLLALSRTYYEREKASIIIQRMIKKRVLKQNEDPSDEEVQLELNAAPGEE
jgi:hypothetical protein